MHGKGATDRWVRALAARQHEVVSGAQLTAMGLSHEAIRWRVATGLLYPRHRGVYAVGRPRLSRHGVWMAAVLALGDRAVLSHHSAGALHGLLRGDGALTDVAVPGSGGRKARPGIRVHRIALKAWETTTVDGVRTTTAARTLMDLSAGASPQRIGRLLARSERLRLYDDVAVRACLAAHPRAPGAARLRAALAAYEEPPDVDSVLERAMLDLCARGCLPRPLTQQLIGVARVDFLWPEHRLVVETDGRDSHATRQAFEDDRARDAELTARGYRVVRFTWLQVRRRPDEVEDVLRRVLTPP